MLGSAYLLGVTLIPSYMLYSNDQVFWALLSLIFPFAVWQIYNNAFDFNKGRKQVSIIVDQNGITTGSGERINKSDIAKIFIKSPKTEQFFYSPGTGLGATGGATSMLASRAWSLRVITRGREVVLAGGLQEPTAVSLMHDVGKNLY